MIQTSPVDQCCCLLFFENAIYFIHYQVEYFNIPKFTRQISNSRITEQVEMISKDNKLKMVISCNRSKFNPSIDKDTQTCAICLDDFKLPDSWYQPIQSKIKYFQKDVVKLHCDRRHIFHTKCLMLWIQTNQTCPICRSKL